MHSFLDEARIFVRSGDGGKGAMHFRREKYVPLGGPDGGDGGQGGSVIFRADRGLNTLFSFRRNRRFVAPNGEAGGPSRMHGRNGEDTIVNVPVGTVLRDGDTGEVSGRPDPAGTDVQVARGGRGGLGNVHFKSSTNQAPHFAEKGEPGQERWIDLELKVIADVGLIGFPNAGKSTLLSVMSAAHPKIADYPFTTLSPNLGVVDTGDFDFVAADIPGLIEGAHEGVGLGHEFLRHIERTLILVHVVDGSADDPLEAFRQVNHELSAVRRVAAAEASDRRGQQARSTGGAGPMARIAGSVCRIRATRRWRFRPSRVRVSTRLIFRLAQFLAEERRLAGAPATAEERTGAEAETIVIKPPASHFEVERKRKTFYVTGEDVERLAVMTDTDVGRSSVPTAASAQADGRDRRAGTRRGARREARCDRERSNSPGTRATNPSAGSNREPL